MNLLMPGVQETPLIGSGTVAEMGRMVEFHTDFTQRDRSRRIILRQREKPETQRMP